MQVLENIIYRIEVAIRRAQTEQVAAKTEHDRKIAIGREHGLGAALTMFKNELEIAQAEAKAQAVAPVPEPEAHAYDVQFEADGFAWMVPVMAPSADDVRREFEARAAEFGWDMQGLVIVDARV